MLPRELLELIALELSYSDILTYRTLNKFFHSVIDEAFWTRKYTRDRLTLPQVSDNYQKNCAFRELLEPFLRQGQEQLQSFQDQITKIIEEGNKWETYVKLQFLEPGKMPILNVFTDTEKYVICPSVSIYIDPSEGQLSYIYQRVNEAINYSHPEVSMDVITTKSRDDYYIIRTSSSGFLKYLQLIIDNGYLAIPHIKIDKITFERFAEYFEVREY